MRPALPLHSFIPPDPPEVNRDGLPTRKQVSNASRFTSSFPPDARGKPGRITCRSPLTLTLALTLPLPPRKDPNNRHHSVVFMLGDMAMIDKIPNVDSSEIHPNRHAGKGVPRIAVPIGNLHHIHKLPLDRPVRPAAVYLEVALCQEQEMRLMHVKFVIFQCPVLDGPVFYRSLRGDDGRRVRRAEKRGVAPSTVMKKFEFGLSSEK
jgi:hypothetical protein